MSAPTLLRVPAKRLRARAIAAYTRAAGYDGVVCFTCGNAARELRLAGLDTLAVGDHEALRPGVWWAPSRIRRIWPGRFDATSGHLPLPLMLDVGAALRAWLEQQPDPGPGPQYVPAGSGETVLCLRWAYPTTEFIAVYNLDDATRYDAQAPLNALVRATGAVVYDPALIGLGRPLPAVPPPSPT